MILGTFHQDASLSSSFLGALCENLPKVQRIEFRDLALSITPRLVPIMLSLRSITLAYVSISNSEIWTVLGSNAGHLEELRLLWVKETTDKPLFQNCKGISLKSLRIFELRGITVPTSFECFRDLLGECVLLQTFHLKSLTVQSATAWTDVLDHILRERPENALLDLRSVSFGAPTHCTDFWMMVSRFLLRCGDCLESLTLNAPVRGVSANHFPASFTEAFIDGMKRQPKLKKIFITWRDDRGVDVDTTNALHSLAPSLEFLHICLPYPIRTTSEEQHNALVEQFKHLTNLRELHLVFPTFLAEEETRNAYVKLNNSIEYGDMLLRSFWNGIAQELPLLEEVSWSTYEANVFLHPRFRHSGKASYVKVRNIETSTF